MTYTDDTVDTVDDSPAARLEEVAAGLVSSARLLETQAGADDDDDRADYLTAGADACLEVAARLLARAHAARLVVEIAEALAGGDDALAHRLIAAAVEVAAAGESAAA